MIIERTCNFDRDKGKKIAIIDKFKIRDMKAGYSCHITEEELNAHNPQSIRAAVSAHARKGGVFTVNEYEGGFLVTRVK